MQDYIYSEIEPFLPEAAPECPYTASEIIRTGPARDPLPYPAESSVREHALGILREVRAEMRVAIDKSFSTTRLLATLRAEVDLYARVESAAARRERLLRLTGLLYAAVELHYSEWTFDVGIDIQVARITYDRVHGGPDRDDCLSVEDWHCRMERKLAQLELHAAPSQGYIGYLVGFAAMAQSALESECRRARNYS